MRSAAYAVVVSADADAAVGVATPHDSIALSGALSFIFAAELCGSPSLCCSDAVAVAVAARRSLFFVLFGARKKEIC